MWCAVLTLLRAPALKHCCCTTWGGGGGVKQHCVHSRARGCAGGAISLCCTTATCLLLESPKERAGVALLLPARLFLDVSAECSSASVPVPSLLHPLQASNRAWRTTQSGACVFAGRAARGQGASAGKRLTSGKCLALAHTHALPPQNPKTTSKRVRREEALAKRTVAEETAGQQQGWDRHATANRSCASQHLAATPLPKPLCTAPRANPPPAHKQQRET